MPLHASNVDDLNKLLFNFSRFSHFLNIWGVNFVWIGVCTLWNVYCQINWCCFCCFGEEPILPHPSPQLQQIKIFAQQGLGKKNPLKINFFLSKKMFVVPWISPPTFLISFAQILFHKLVFRCIIENAFEILKHYYNEKGIAIIIFCIDNSNGL